MTDNRDHFEEFDPHTRLKHEVLEAYLQAYAFKLLSGPKRDRVWVLDGFAGRGCDMKGNQGSPTRACRVAAQVRTRFTAPPKRLGIVCIEMAANHFAHLQAHLKPFSDQDPAHLVLLPGAFADRCGDALARIGGEPVFAFLDPFGIKGLEASTYRPLLAAPASEIFMLVAHAGSARLGGTMTAADRRYEEVSRLILAQGSLFGDQAEADLAAATAARDQAKASSRATAEASRQIFIEALGETHAAGLDGLSLTDLSTKFIEVMDAVLRRAGAKYITFFRVRDDSGTEKHVLMHATTSPIGVVAMKEAISSALSDETLPAIMRDRLRLDLQVDVEAIAEAAAEHHAGESLPWARTADDSIQREPLVLTPLFTFQTEALLEEFKHRGWFLARDPVTKKQMIRFPAR